MATQGNPVLMQLMQRLAATHRPGGAPGGGPGPGGGDAAPGVDAARMAARTPQGFESEGLAELMSKIGTLINRIVPRSSEAASEFLKAYRAMEKGKELLAQLPAQPVAAPPPGLPFTGGPAGTPPMGEGSPPAFM